MTHSKMWHSKHNDDGKDKYGGRNVVGYAKSAPNPQWPQRAKVALNFVINYMYEEEGGEKCLLHDDVAESDNLLTKARGKSRQVSVESLYDYGSRAGFWRLHRLFTQKNVPCTVFAVGVALERNPQACKAMKKANWEVATHGYRWIDYQNVDKDTEREHIARTIEIHKHLLGKRPVGFYQGKPSTNTRKLVMEEGGFLYDSDSYADDLPYWNLETAKKPHLIVPYTLSENDIQLVNPGGFSNAQDFCQHLKSTLKYMVDEGRAGHARMMTVGLHCQIVGRPGRAAALAEFMDYAKTFRSDVWICTREEIAQHWHDNHCPRGGGTRRGGTVAPPKPLAEAAATTLADNDEAIGIRPATLSKNPKDLHVLWREYENGLEGRKAAKFFTSAQRGRVKALYHRRKVVWDAIATLIRAGNTADVAIDRIYQAYGHGSSITSICAAMLADRRTGGHHNLRVGQFV